MKPWFTATCGINWVTSKFCAADPELSDYVRETAQAAAAEHCSGCHGNDLSGTLGVPDLTDYDWLWGVTGQETNDVAPVMAIQQTLLYGVRNRDCPEDQMSYGACADTRYSEMPGYGVPGFTEEQLSDLTGGLGKEKKSRSK